MRQGLAVALGALLALPTVSRAEGEYAIDSAHTGVTFKISHLGLSWVFGRFNDVSGQFTLDPNTKGKSAFAMTIKTDSIDTANAKRDEHLRSPEFFDVKQFPQITFKSTSVKAIDGGYEVTGDFTLRGVTKSLNFTLKGGKSAEFPKGVERTGFTTELIIKRADFGMDKMLQAIGNDVHIAISFEGVKK